MMLTVEEHLIADAPPEHADRWHRLIPDQLRELTHPGVHQVLENVMCLDAALTPDVWKELATARSVDSLRAQYRALAMLHTPAHPACRSVPSIAEKVDALLHFLQQQAAPSPGADVPLSTLQQRCQWVWVVSTMHAAFVHPVLSELGRLRQGKLPRN